MAHPSTTEQGSVLMWILIAVVLLAGLTAAMNQGSRTSTGVVTGQEARLAASEIMSYSNTVKQAVHRLLLKGCSEGDISFQWSQWQSSELYDNTSSPPDESCHVFSPKGGGVSGRFADKSWLDPSLSTLVNYGDITYTGNIRILDVGTDQPELVMYIAYIRPEICEALNDMLGMSKPLPADGASGGVNRFLGDYSLASNPDLGDEESRLKGKTAFCFQNTDHAFTLYLYAQTLIER